MSRQQQMIRVYDRLMAGRKARRYYGNSGFFNFGYWATQAKSQREASEALVDALVAMIPERRGRILDVACGLGASTERLTRFYPPEAITAVNISEAQLAAARKRVPDATFLRMDATRLAFPDATFDAAICVEAAFHFDTRDAFLREVFRVLKRGGSLVISDILFRPVMGRLAERGQIPRANLVPTIEAYRARLAAAGFEAIDAKDATEECLGAFRTHLGRWPMAEHRAGRMSFRSGIAASIVCRGIAGYFGLLCKTYVLASARKPV